ncbi:MAG: PilN domain-containing protein, partial [Dehalococcoidia bacterium]
KVTISADKNVIRVVVFRGREVLAWGTTQVQESLADQDEAAPEDQGPRERLQNLLKRLGVRRGRVVTDLPLQAPLMRYLELPKMRRRYLDQAVASEILETIPFSQEEVDLTWEVRSEGEDQEVLAVALSKEVVDEQVQLLAGSGIRPKAAYSKAVALAHAAGVSDGIVLHIEQSHAAFVLVHQGMPRSVYQVELDGNFTTPEEQVEALSRAVEEVAGYGQTIGSENGIQPLPVVLTGQVTEDNLLVQLLRQAIKREVLPLATPLVYPEHFSPNEYAVNLGLALADQAKSKTRLRDAKAGLATLNLLPARHLPRPLPIRPIAAFVGLALLGIVAFNLGDQVDATSAEADTLSRRMSGMQRQERQLRITLATRMSVEEDIQSLVQLGEALESSLANIQSDLQGQLVQMEMITRDGLPPTTSLSSLLHQGGQFTLSGTASSYEEVLQYIDNLRTSGLFAEVRLLETAESGSEAIDPITGEPGTQIASFQAKITTAFAQGQDDAASQ